MLPLPRRINVGRPQTIGFLAIPKSEAGRKAAEAQGDQ
jgi:hypothetical protein